jgi:ribosomal protein L37AE/L43A
MEKYAVVIDEEKTKQGSVTTHRHEVCPECEEGVVDRSGSVPVCPICGTKPFEKRPDSKP